MTTPAERTKHIQSLCDSTVENIELYLNRLNLPLNHKLMIAEQVFINTLARHVASAFQLVDWRDNFPTQEHFRTDFTAHILDRVRECIWAMEKQL